MATKIRKLYDGFTYDADEVSCEYCKQTPNETEIQKAYASDTYICGDIGCWNEYCWEWVWAGNSVEIEEEEYEACDECEENIDEDGCICINKEEDNG